MRRGGSGACPRGVEPEAYSGFQWEYHQGDISMRNFSRILAILGALGPWVYRIEAAGAIQHHFQRKTNSVL